MGGAGSSEMNPSAGAAMMGGAGRVETKPLALLGLLCWRALVDPIARFPRHELQERIHPEIRATPNADPA